MNARRTVGAAGVALLLTAVWWFAASRAGALQPTTLVPAPRSLELAGSTSCRECHEKFHQLWSTSHHGTAMQPYTPAIAQHLMTPPTDDVTIGDRRYRADLDQGRVTERGPDGDKTWPILHLMGGKNVFFLLTALDRGRLQVLPVAYDVRQREWYDTTSSMVRHLGGERDGALHWTDPLLTFNTSCFGCHVSQLATNYDVATASYRTTWQEPGINCETCHGPSADHVRVCKAASPAAPPADLRILRYRQLDVDQRNAACASCHAKGMPISARFVPGDAFFDHGDLTTYEDADYYPDGRDLGENYTYTSWLESACVQSGKLDCIHCHTSSGRYRFAADERANDACRPCHQQRVDEGERHHHHAAGTPGSRCIDCHMPKTTFARMARSDHSLRPPMPAATRAFGSPNACNLCHQDQDAAWADATVRTWHADDYQQRTLERGRLIVEARAGRWQRLDDMLGALQQPGRSEVFAASMIRLLVRCGDGRKGPALLAAMRDASPLVRGAAARALDGWLTPDACRALLDATQDRFRLVRVRAAATLAPLPREDLAAVDRQRLDAATREYLQALGNRTDDWASYYNRANFHDSRGDAELALADFDMAAKLRPDVVPPLLNASVLYARLGRNQDAEATLRRALAIAPKDASVNFNFGLLMAEQGDATAAEQALRTALASDPEMAAAAHNLGILLAADRPGEALVFSRQACALEPGNARYAHTLAFYLQAAGRRDEAVQVLREAIARRPAVGEPYALLAQLLAQAGRRDEAAAVLQGALGDSTLPAAQKQGLFGLLQSL